MEKRFLALFAVVMLLMQGFASAGTTYTEIGGGDGGFTLGTGQFNEQLTSDISFTKTLGSPRFTPLVADLDADGTNEIIAFDAGTIRLYSGKELSIVDSFSVGGTIWSPPIVFNIKDDGASVEQNVNVNLMPTKDTYLEQANPNTIHGTEATLLFDRATAAEERVLLQFDISSIPSNAVITNALLVLNTTVEAGGTATAELRKVSSSWTEAGATWNTYDGTNPWSSAGGDVSPSVYATFAAPDGAVPIIVTVNATLLVNEWFASGGNNGFLIKTQATAGSQIKTFHSREAGQSTPRLSVSYVLPPGTAPDKPELIIATGTTVQILRYNGTSLFNLSTIPNGITGVNHKEVMVGCRDTEACLLYHTSSTNEGTPPVTDSIQVVTFNSTSLSGNTATIQSGTTRQACLPQIPMMQVGDADNDGDEEYVFSTLNIASSGSDEIHIYYVSQNTTGVKGAFLMRDVIAATVALVNVQKDSVNCDVSTNFPAGEFPPGKFVSSPLLFDIDGSASNGLEAVIAHAVDADEFIMRSFEGTTSAELDRYPEILNADGRILSNPAILKSFPDHSGEDFCVLGYKQDADRLDLLCASEQTGATPQTEEFIFSSANFTNVTSGYQNHAAIIHGVQDSTETTDGTNLNELLHYYGVSKLVLECAFFAPDNCLELIWDVPQVGTLIQVDAEQSGLEDIISLTPTNIWYFDDAFTNAQAEITDYTINPCLDSVWQQGTTVNVQVNANDPENDLVSARVKLYNGEAEEDDSGWSGFTSDSSTFSFGFTANETTGISTLRMMVRDEEHLSDAQADIIDVTFSVASSGVEFGDCTTTVDVEASGGGDGNESVLLPDGTDPDNNAINSGLEAAGDLFGFGKTVMWIILMLLMSLAIIQEAQGTFRNHANALVSVLLIVNGFMVILGAFLGIIGVGTILLLAILGLIAIGIWVARVSHGQGG